MLKFSEICGIVVGLCIATIVIEAVIYYIVWSF